MKEKLQSIKEEAIRQIEASDMPESSMRCVYVSLEKKES